MAFQRNSTLADQRLIKYTRLYMDPLFVRVDNCDANYISQKKRVRTARGRCRSINRVKGREYSCPIYPWIYLKVVSATRIERRTPP